ncbi:hypothetical protein [Reticulibacter mediterranei]|nr:hypothetical protein [Reticulibacter mediterranei]
MAGAMACPRPGATITACEAGRGQAIAPAIFGWRFPLNVPDAPIIEQLR